MSNPEHWGNPKRGSNPEHWSNSEQNAGDADRNSGDSRDDGRGTGGARPSPRPYRPGIISGEAWNVVGTLLAGIGFWGLVGYGIDRITGIGTVFLPVGILVGMGAAVYLVIYRTTRRF